LIYTHLRALRLGPEQSFVLVAPDGSAWQAVWPGGRVAELRCLEQLKPDPCAPVELFTAWPKGKRAEQLVLRACEAGVRRIRPVVFERSVSGREVLSPNQLARLGRIAREACQQLNRPYLTQIEAEPVLLDELLQAPSRTSNSACYALHPDAPNLASLASAQETSEFSLLIGPEGGFSDEELPRIAAADWQFAGLLPTILRIEAAGPWGAGLIQHAVLGKSAPPQK